MYASVLKVLFMPITQNEIYIKKINGIEIYKFKVYFELNETRTKKNDR